LPATGIVWDGEGLILTAHHVLERDENINVGFEDGETVTAELVGRDPATDLALLRTTKRDSSIPAWAGPEDLRVGHMVLALGRPGKNVRATLGIVSALGDSWRTPAGGPVDRYLQTDTVMYPGFSGGPLVDAQGRFVGLNTSALLRGVSITVPVPILNRVVQDLSEHKPGYCSSRWSRAAPPRREGCSWEIPWFPWAGPRCVTWMTYSPHWTAASSASPSPRAYFGADAWRS